MPLYEYFCSECGERFTLLRPIRDRDAEAQCPKCGASDCRPLISVCAPSGKGAVG